MTTFAQILETRSLTPERHVVLEPSAWADDWNEKPVGEFAFGLRKISDADTQTARAEAVKYAISMHDDREGQIESYNDALMRWLIIRGTCDSNNVLQNAPIFDGSEENLRNALTSKAIRYVWDEMERYHLECSPVVSEATDEDFLELGELLKRPELLGDMSRGGQKRFRKLIGFCLAEMRTVLEEIDEG